MVQEAAGAGGTDRVHAEVGYDAVVDDNYLAVLPAYLQDGADFRHVVDRSGGVAGYFVLDQVGVHNDSGEVAGAAGRA